MKLGVEARFVGDAEVKEKLTRLGKENRDALIRVMHKSVIVVEGRAKDKCPVDTSRLRNSITHLVELGLRILGKIGTPVDYAPYVELGTVNMAAQPYLIPALKESKKDIINFIKIEIRRIKP